MQLERSKRLWRDSSFRDRIVLLIILSRVPKENNSEYGRHDYTSSLYSTSSFPGIQLQNGFAASLAVQISAVFNGLDKSSDRAIAINRTELYGTQAVPYPRRVSAGAIAKCSPIWFHHRNRCYHQCYHDFAIPRGESSLLLRRLRARVLPRHEAGCCCRRPEIQTA